MRSLIGGVMFKDFWGWLATLPPGSASFVGTLTGSSLGLVAILIGALFNAHLNRRRDDALRDANRVALASALYAELQGIHRTLLENAQHLTEKPPSAGSGFVVPALTIKLLPEVLSNVGLLKADTIRPVLDAYILAEQYLDRLILTGGKLQDGMPETRQLVYLDASNATHVVEFNKVTAQGVKDGMDALIPYLK
jgi:hypothetical protein